MRIVKKTSFFAANKRLLLTGIIANFVIFTVPLLRYIFRYYGVVVHELGHTITYWLFGYIAIPALRPGSGGVTYFVGPFLWLRMGLIALFAFVTYRWWKSHVHPIKTQNGPHGIKTDVYRSAKIIAVVWITYLIFLIVKPLHETLAIFMGKGGELIGAMILSYCALSPYVKRPVHEKYVMMILGMSVYFHSLYFSYALCFNEAFINQYRDSEQDMYGVDNDFVILSDKLSLPMSFFVLQLLFVNALSLYVLHHILKKYPCNIFSHGFQKLKQMLINA